MKVTPAKQAPAGTSKSEQLPTGNPRVKVLDRGIGLFDAISRNTRNDEEQREAIEIKALLTQRRQQLIAA